MSSQSACCSAADADVIVLRDKATLALYSRDYHNLKQQTPFGVVIATTEDHVVAALSFAKKNGLKAVVRASGHGSGSVLRSGGLIIDISQLRSVYSVSAGSVSISAGASWHDALDALAKVDCCTVAQTDWQGLSIGGILSVGGLGPALFRAGPLLQQVVGLVVVTGSGEKLHLRRGQPLFKAVLGGQGQFGVIVRAEIGHLQCPKWRRARVYRVISSWEAMATAYPSAVQHPRIANLQSFPRLDRPSAFAHFDTSFAGLDSVQDGAWVALSEFVVFYNNDEEAPDDSELLQIFEALSDKHSSVEDIAYDDWIFRLDHVLGPRAGPDHTHDHHVPRPWFEVFIGGNDLPDAIGFVEENYLHQLSPEQEMPRGSLAVLYSLPPDLQELRSTSDSMAMPAGFRTGVFFGLLRVAPDPDTATRFDSRHEEWHQRLLRSGRGRGYLSSTLPRSLEQRVLFYGADTYRHLLQLVMTHDPGAVLSWKLTEESATEGDVAESDDLVPEQ